MSASTRLGRRADVTLRQRMEDAVERLLAALDAMDGDWDIEADPAESGLGDIDAMVEQFGGVT